MRSSLLATYLVIFLGAPLGAATFTVNNVGDAPDANTGDNVCATAGAVCTLRAAIQQANATAGTDTIAFSISGTISPGSALPSITQAVTIDAINMLQLPSITLAGGSAGAGTNGLTFAAGSNGSTLRGFAVQGFGGVGVLVQADGCVVERTYLGTNLAGTAAAGNVGAGLSVSGSSNTFGVNGDGSKRILASGNGGGGVTVSGSSNTFHFAHAGTNLAGTAALANTGSGITISGSSNTLIQNTLSGNTQDGLRITAGTGNVLRTNSLIGLNDAGNAAIPNGGHGVNVTGGTGNTIGPADIISGNGGSGVVISGAATAGNFVRGNFIGTTLAGTVALPNAQGGVLLNGAGANTIGGSGAGHGNVISGNTGIGVRAVGGSGSVIQANVVGTAPSGNSALGNSSHGISVEGAASTTVGGSVGLGNLVSGNGGNGIQVGGASAGSVLNGNTVGTVVAGTSPLPNALDGILLTGTTNVTVGGGVAVGDDNVVGGNGQHGLHVLGGGNHQINVNEFGVSGTGVVAVGNTLHGVYLENTTGNTIDTALISGNHVDGVRISGGGGNTLIADIIGLDVTGTVALGNWGNGVTILNSPNNTIGHPVGGEGNTISGNLQSGLAIVGVASGGNVVHNTLIGPNIIDNATIGNGGWGVLISAASGNSIGGALAGQANRIRGNGAFYAAFNGGNGSGGIAVQSGTNNEISRNLVSGNLGLGIDLDPDGALPFDGVTANDAGDGDGGGNLAQNRPLITSATFGGTTAVSGTLSSAPNTTYDVEVFHTARCDPSGHGEGGTFAAVVSTTTNGAGAASWNTNFAAVPAGSVLTATATDPGNNTSEFSNCFPIFAGAPIQFDADAASELFVFNAGAWLQFDYASGNQVGGVWTGTAGGCRQVMMDFDGDGTDDFTQLCGGAWHFYNDNGSYNKGIWVGNTPGNLPVPADYDGDGRDDVVLYNAGAWVWFDFTSGTYQAARSVFTGVSGGGQIPAPTDWDGDGKAERSVYVAGAWHFFNDDGSYLKGIWVGAGNTFPVPGDYDGDAHDDVMIFRDGSWAFYDFATGAYVPGKSVFTGTPPHMSGGTTTPEPLDVDGNGIMDFSLFAGGPWHFYNPNGTYAKGIWTGGVGELPLSARPLQ